jgi:hypothetical protein
MVIARLKTLYGAQRRRVSRFLNRREIKYHASIASSSCDDYKRGTPEWLVLAELKYGGLQKEVPRRKVSGSDPRTPSELIAGGMIGGDRMSANHHGYARKYAQYLAPFLERDPAELTIVEVGILKGTGLAMWADLFPRARIIGLDIDLSHFRDNLGFLKSLNAFAHRDVVVHELDQFRDNADYLGQILGGASIDVMIDDGFHSEETILKTLESARPHLAQRFVYFVEDNDKVGKLLRSSYPMYDFDCSTPELTVIHSRS